MDNKLYQIIQVLLLLTLTIGCTKSVTQELSLQDYVVNNLKSYSTSKSLYVDKFTWDTLKMPEIKCNAYKVLSTNNKKLVNLEAEKITVIIDNTNTKYLLRKVYFPRQPFVADCESNLADLELFINDQDSKTRIKQLANIINFHQGNYYLNTQIMAEQIDSNKVNHFKVMVINTLGKEKEFCSNVFKDALNGYFFDDQINTEQFIIAYLYEESIVSFWVWQNGNNGHYHLKKKLFDANNYFLDKARSYNCPY